MAAQLVNINTASLTELQTLSGVGSSIAQSIIDNRPYTSIEEISRASGIGAPGSSSYEKIKNYITVGGESPQTQLQNQIQATSTDVQSPSTQTIASSGSNIPPPITVTIRANAKSFVGAGSFFDGAAFGTQGEPLGSARFLWSFGDGTTAEGQHVTHSYRYPGTYVVVLTGANNFSTTQSTLIVEAVPAQVALILENDLSLTVVNNSTELMDVGRWSLMCGDGHFSIPQKTFVVAQGGVRFGPTVMGLTCDLSAQLLYPNGSVSAKAQVSDDSPAHGQPVSPAQLKRSLPRSEPPLSGGLAQRSELVAAAVEADKGPVPTWVLYGAGLLSIIVLGVTAAWYARSEDLTFTSEETVSEGDEFDIYEQPRNS